LNKWVDAGDFDGLSDAINIGRKTAQIGDAHGFADRKKRYDNALVVLTGRAAYVAPVAPVVVVPSVAPEVSTRVRSTTRRTLQKAQDSTE